MASSGSSTTLPTDPVKSIATRDLKDSWNKQKVRFIKKVHISYEIVVPLVTIDITYDCGDEIIDSPDWDSNPKHFLDHQNHWDTEVQIQISD